MNRQSGVTLIELMIAIVISLIVLAGVSSVFISTILSSRQVVAGARLNQEMGLILDRMVSDIRRAGYWGDEILDRDIGERANPFMNALTKPRIYNYDGLANNCITYAYNEEGKTEDPATVDVCSGCTLSGDLSDAATYSANGVDIRGFRLTFSGGLEELISGSSGGTASTISCTAGSWERVSDSNTVNITGLTFQLTSQQATTITLPSGENYVVDSWKVDITMDGKLANDSQVQKTLDTTVTLGNMDIEDDS